MGAKLGNRGGPMAEINVTPLIDVVLVLLVVFMVITPMLSSGMPVDLPVATSTNQVNDAGQFVVISIVENGDIAIEQEFVTLDTLIDGINVQYAKAAAKGATKEILIKGDAQLEYGKVREVMDKLAEYRITAVKLAANKGQ
jgi:biopolymer transport protein TolR